MTLLFLGLRKEQRIKYKSIHLCLYKKANMSIHKDTSFLPELNFFKNFKAAAEKKTLF